jgi:hypothetical protein
MEYLQIYNQIIERAKNRILEGYKEKHHIVPKCLGGNNDKDNLVELTAKEHFLCHMLLCEIYSNNNKLWYALFLMATNKNKKSHQKYKISSRTYERIKLEHIKKIKDKPKPNGFGDKIKSNERNKKIGISNSKPKPEGFGENHSKLLKGKPKPEGFGEKVIKSKSKPILQYDKQWNFIKKWKNAVEASKELKINKSQINAVARGNTKYKTAGNYFWKYENKN